MTPTPAERATTGFTVREFAQLETLGAAAACEVLRPRIDLLLESLNTTALAARVVDLRKRSGATATKLFHANSCHPGGPGHIYVFHHGGRWEPQFNVGWFAGAEMGSCVRIGIGFNTSAAGRDLDREAGQERVLLYFERFQRTLSKAWRNELARWLSANSGFLQYGAQPPSLQMQPADAVEWLVASRNAAAVEWIFVGRWLFLDRADDAAILRDRAKLARAADDTFRALLPIWLTTYADDGQDSVKSF